MSVNQENTKLDAAQFGDLHKTYHGRLLNSMTSVVRDRQAAEEITAAAFAKALQYLATFRGEASFYTWLRAIASNEARQYWRGDRGISLESVTGPVPEALVECDSVADRLDQSAEQGRLENAMQGIPANYRRALKDHFIRGHSIRQIARRERIPVGTVLSRIFTAKKLLRQAWEVSRRKLP
jgi:RNA polymerase sigma-70 factor (ECF subfamily)